MARILLLSNSTAPGRAYLEHAREILAETLDGVAAVAFVPYALADLDAYTATVAAALAPFGVTTHGVHESRNVLSDSGAVFVGGGNTFRLVKRLHEEGLIGTIRDAVGQGTPYIGSSAGTNVACPKISTTNDMPIVEPPSFDALRLVPFQINPHYVDPDPASIHQGETRQERIQQYLEENPGPVLGMREGTWLTSNGAGGALGGIAAGARLFTRSGESEIAPGMDLGHLWRARP